MKTAERRNKAEEPLMNLAQMVQETVKATIKELLQEELDRVIAQKEESLYEENRDTIPSDRENTLTGESQQ